MGDGLRLAQGAQQVGQRDHGGEDHQEAGDQALETPLVEAEEADAAGVLHLAHEEQGDQEAGEDEEGVDAEESVGEPARVVQQDGDDRDAAQSVDRGEATGGSGDGCGSGCGDGGGRYGAGGRPGRPSGGVRAGLGVLVVEPLRGRGLRGLVAGPLVVGVRVWLLHHAQLERFVRRAVVRGPLHGALRSGRVSRNAGPARSGPSPGRGRRRSTGADRSAARCRCRPGHGRR